MADSLSQLQKYRRSVCLCPALLHAKSRLPIGMRQTRIRRRRELLQRKSLQGAVVMILFMLLPLAAQGQDLSEDELQVTMNGYFDNFNVNIVYPSMSFTKRVSDSTTVNLRYLVDVISAASMRSHFDVDGVSSATPKEDGGGDDVPDEMRQEFGLGFTDLLKGGLIRGGSFSLNTIYSTEHDYTSFTLAGSFSYLMARKNTTLQLGVVRSWDTVAPQIRDWKRKKDVYTISLGVTQILSPRLISQLNYSHNQSNGMLSDAYQVVQIAQNGDVTNYEPVHPDARLRRALGLQMNYKAGSATGFNFGLRYYWDDWDVKSLTASVLWQRHLNPAMTVGLGLRHYRQSKAFFFKSEYLAPEQYMTVDTKLASGYSNDYQLTLTIRGGYWRLPVLASEKTQLNLRVNFYHRHSSTPDWHSRLKDLFAYLVSLGVRYKF